MHCLSNANRLPLLLLLAITCVGQVDAAEVSRLVPRSCKPGQTTQLTLHGKDLDESLRVIASSAAAEVRIESIEATKAVLDLTLPKDFPLGPFALWSASASGPHQPLIILADDLEVVADNGNNHSIDSAQTVATLSAVDGICDGSQSDFYRLSISEGQRVAFEIHTQQIQSAMDPVLRIIDSEGNEVVLADDGAVGPDCRFSHQFVAAGEYVVQVYDNRYSSGGSAYHLRIGDFPIIRHGYPLAVRRGEPTQVSPVSLDGSIVPERNVEAPHGHFADSITVDARLEDGESSAWVSVLASDMEQFREQGDTAPEPLSIPIGISGWFSEPGQRDSYPIRGRKDEKIRVSSQTRSLGCPTLLQMQLQNENGVKVAETKVSDADQWSFEYTFPDDGVYLLDVGDLLKRGGQEFAYWIEIKPAGDFSVGLKADAKGRQQFAVEEEHGACAIDLQISRFDYDGAIDISLANPIEGLHILNPRIAAKAKEARIYLVAKDGWKPSSLATVRLLATAVDSRNLTGPVSSRALQRTKQPFVLVPPAWNDGAILVAGVIKSESPFALGPAAGIRFARPLQKHSADLTLKRINKEFKQGVTLLGTDLPPGWNVAVKVDKDTYKATFSQPKLADAEPNQLSLLAFAEFKDRGRIERFNLPVEWFDPLSVKLEFADPLVRGGEATVRAKIVRTAVDPQPVILDTAALPAGLTGPESVTIAANRNQVDFQLQVSPDAKPDSELTVNATSKFRGHEFSIASDPVAVAIVEAPRRLQIHPSELVLDGKNAHQQLIVTGFDEDDAPRDWTHHAKISISNPVIAKVDGAVIYPTANGDAEVLIQVGGTHQSLPVRVLNIENSRPVEFESELLVALSKQGCNSGACHGSPSGKGGFRLSLRAFDKKLDELTLIRESFGRRVNPLDPDQSLILLKPLMKLAHGGGKQLRTDDAAYRILRRWVAEGASTDPPETTRCQSLEVFPDQKLVLDANSGGQQISVTARFPDRTRDVTHLAAYESSNPKVATVDARGFVQQVGQGETVILVRFLEHIESIPLMFVEQVEGFQWKSPPPNNYIDELVGAKLRQLHYLPSQTCSDAEFLRRVYLDVIGILPTVGETQAFLADANANKRVELIDKLLQRDEYAKFWALKWGDLLKLTGKMVGDEGVYKYHRWLEQSLRQNMPYDQFARQLLTASGSTLTNPPANFYRTAADMNECVETISQVFLGARLQCAKCHNHPFERWTQDNYYGLAAFFHGLRRRKTERPGEMFIYATEAGEVIQPRTGETMPPWLPVLGTVSEIGDEDRRQVFANWLVDAKNPSFARIEANRIWSQLFARGIVDPIDDFRDSNPPSNEPLLDALAQDFINSGYDRKHLLRTILSSRTYQAGYQTNESNLDDNSYFSHQQPRLLSAEQLLDAINQALGLEQKFGNLPAGTKATQLIAPDLVEVDFLKTFGQSERNTVCACERPQDSNLGMAIELFNGKLIHEKLRDPKNRFRTAISAGQSVEQAVRDMYLAAVCRQPTQPELTAALEHCATRQDTAAGLEDICWALFNTDEFLFQH